MLTFAFGVEGVIQTMTSVYIFKHVNSLFDLLDDIMASKAVP